MIKTSKGFTIVELLVVIAIIAVLVGIVLVNVVAYINQGKDAAIQGNLSTIGTNAAVLFDTTESYTGFCINEYYTNPSDAISAAFGPGNLQTCFVSVDGDAFCACSNLKVGGNTFCVDSTGARKIANTTCAIECSSADSPVCQ